MNIIFIAESSSTVSLNPETQALSTIIYDLFTGLNFEAAKTSLIQLASSLNLNSQLVADFATLVKEIKDTYEADPTSPQLFLTLDAYRSSYKVLILGSSEFHDFFNQVIEYSLNQEAVQMLATFDEKVEKMSVSEAITFFRSKEGADEIAKAFFVLKQVYERFMQKGEFEFIPKSSHKFLSM
jgi:hypothetical protein